MRIALDGIPLAAPKTGIGHYTFELARELARLRPADDFELLAPVDISAPVRGEFGAELPRNLRPIRANTAGLRLRWWSLGLPLYARENRLALFHGTNYNVPLWNQCPAIITVHDLSLLLYSETHREDLVRRARTRLPTMIRSAAHVLTDSESVRREIIEHLGVPPCKVTAVALAPRRAFRRADETERRAVCRRLGVEDDFLLFVGTVEPRKNLITLVRAFEALLRETDLRPQLVIAGQRGWLSDDLFSLIAQTGARERVLFTGYISDEELRALYSSCRLTVYPSVYEGFGLPPLEAMACGAPVVASRIPVIVETLGDAACLVPATDARELSRAIAALLTDEGACAHFAERGRERVALFTWERTARLTLDVYEEVWRERATSTVPVARPTIEAAGLIG